MTKEQVRDVFTKHEHYMMHLGINAITEEKYDKVITEIISLYQTDQADVVIDPEKEMLDGFNMKQKNCKHEHSSVKKIDHSETTMECMDCGKILYLPERP